MLGLDRRGQFLAEMAPRIVGAVEGARLRIAQRRGGQLRGIRAAEIPGDVREGLAGVGRKADPEGVFPFGALTYGDLHAVVKGACSLASTEPPGFAATPEGFACWAGGEGVGPDDVISGRVGPVTVFPLPVEVNVRREEGGSRLVLTPDGNDLLVKAQVAAVSDRLRECGLPLGKAFSISMAE